LYSGIRSISKSQTRGRTIEMAAPSSLCDVANHRGVVVVALGDPVVVQGVPVDAPPAVEAVPGAEGAVLPAVVEGLDPAVEPGIVVHGAPAVDPFAPFGVAPVVFEVPAAPVVGVVPGVGAGWDGVAVPAGGVAVPAPGVAVPGPGVAVPAPGVAVPAPGVAVPAPGVVAVPAPGVVVVPAGSVAVPPGGTLAPGVEVCPGAAVVGAAPAGAVCATIQLAQPKSSDIAKSLSPDISVLQIMNS